MKLTEREKTVLEMRNSGTKISDIADHFRVSVHSINYCLKQAKEKVEENTENPFLENFSSRAAFVLSRAGIRNEQELIKWFEGGRKVWQLGNVGAKEIEKVTGKHLIKVGDKWFISDSPQKEKRKPEHDFEWYKQFVKNEKNWEILEETKFTRTRRMKHESIERYLISIKKELDFNEKSIDGWHRVGVFKIRDETGMLITSSLEEVARCLWEEEKNKYIDDGIEISNVKEETA